MGEMHLIYAEALAETGNLTKACDEVDKVRARVGLGKIAVMNPTLNLTTNKRILSMKFYANGLLNLVSKKIAF